MTSQERAAFENAFGIPPRIKFDPTLKCYVTNAQPGTWLSNCCQAANIRLQGWTAAVKYAAEMAKPECTIYETMGDTFTVRYKEKLNTMRANGFATEADATVWAAEHGFRVVQE